jgi:lipopolysaccharide export system permease protein
VSTVQAEQGQIETDGSWTLRKVVRQEFDIAGQQSARIVRNQHQSYSWPSAITAEMVSVALLKPDRMRTTDLYAYVQHLEANGQTAQRYEIEFWRKVFYPLSLSGDGGAGAAVCLPAFPLGQHHRLRVRRRDDRHQLLPAQQRVRLHRQPQPMAPWLAAASPAIIYSVVSLGAFGWLVLRR